MRQIIKNGTIVTGGGSFPADILIDGEKIEQLQAQQKKSES